MVISDEAAGGLYAFGLQSGPVGATGQRGQIIQVALKLLPLQPGAQISKTYTAVSATVVVWRNDNHVTCDNQSAHMYGECT